MIQCHSARVTRRQRASLLLALLAWAWPLHAHAQGTADGDRVMTTVRAALAPALPFPDADDTGSPVNASPVPLWVVRPLLPGDRSIEVTANPLNAVNQTRAARAMAQIGASIDLAQRRAELQYENAIAEAKRTGRSQDVDGVTLSDEGIAGARIDAEAHVLIDVEFNQPVYTVAIESSVAPAPARSPVTIAGAVAVVTVPANTYRSKTAQRSEERYTAAETLVYFGGLAPPEVRERSANAYEVTSAAAPATPAPVSSLMVRLRGNEGLIADIVAKADWKQVLGLVQ
jgi:hypothetical protein